MLSHFSCVRLSNPMDYSPPGSSVHGILQARILEWVAIPFSRGSFLTQESNPGLLHSKQFLHHLSHQRSLLSEQGEVSQASLVAQLVKKLLASAGDLRDMDSVEESEKVGLKLHIQKTKVMASSPITSWQIDGGKQWKQ